MTTYGLPSRLESARESIRRGSTALGWIDISPSAFPLMDIRSKRPFGWASEGWTIERARETLLSGGKAKRTGEGPEDARERADARRAAEQRAADEKRTRAQGKDHRRPVGPVCQGGGGDHEQGQHRCGEAADLDRAYRAGPWGTQELTTLPKRIAARSSARCCAPRWRWSGRRRQGRGWKHLSAAPPSIQQGAGMEAPTARTRQPA